MTTLYNIDRQSAARILNVSVRTIDRYISSGEIRKVKTRGRTWLSNDDVKRLLSQSGGIGKDSVASYFFPDQSQDKVVSDDVSNKNEQENVEIIKEVFSEKKIEEKTQANFKNLYTEARNQLEEKNKRLQQATYRIGQLESKLKQMVPLIEFQKQKKALQQSNQNFQVLITQERQKREQVTKNLLGQIKQIEHELESEKFNKAIFALLLFLVIFITLLVILIVYI